jgi:hypothetical protein
VLPTTVYGSSGDPASQRWILDILISYSLESLLTWLCTHLLVHVLHIYDAKNVENAECVEKPAEIQTIST